MHDVDSISPPDVPFPSSLHWTTDLAPHSIPVLSLSTEYRLKSQSINATRRSRMVFWGAWCIHAHHHRNFAVLHSPAQSSLLTISESARPLFSLLFSRAPPLSLASSRHPYSFFPPSPDSFEFAACNDIGPGPRIDAQHNLHRSHARGILWCVLRALARPHRVARAIAPEPLLCLAPPPRLVLVLRCIVLLLRACSAAFPSAAPASLHRVVRLPLCCPAAPRRAVVRAPVPKQHHIALALVLVPCCAPACLSLRGVALAYLFLRASRTRLPLCRVVGRPPV
ncbi:hypothetical protein C8J57DRAFT_1721111 [Mycena rebaudengoi]|nr:hypothetical protein C8J57DRAFT_1721111 [Mycena rebaudengoi]